MYNIIIYIYDYVYNLIEINEISKSFLKLSTSISYEINIIPKMK